MPILILIFLGLFIITIIIAVIHSSTKHTGIAETCNSDSDCPSSDICVLNPETKTNQCIPANKKFCSLQPFTALTQCTCENPDENGVCQNPIQECDKCLNNPAFSCIQVTNKNPYTWKQGTTSISMPNSPTGYGWCLPNAQNRNAVCNPFTSDYILSETAPGQYEWGCYCKYENLFDHAQGPLSDCTFVRACGSAQGSGVPLGSLYVPSPKNISCTSDSECSDNEKCLSPQNPPPCGYAYDKQPHENSIKNDCTQPGANCVCHTRWETEEIVNNVDPLTGQCVCNDNLDYQCVVRSNDYFEMNCVQGFCDPFGTSNSDKCNQNQCYGGSGNCTCCDCPKGYIRCPDDIPEDNQGLISYCLNVGPMCVPDPCATTDVPQGYFNPSLPGCVCPGGKTNIASADPDSAVGEICVNACKSNGSCGNRGECILPEGATDAKQAICANCVCPWTNEQDPSCTCSYMVKGPNGYKKSAGSDCEHDDECCSGDCTGGGIGPVTGGYCKGTDQTNSPPGSCTAQVICPDGKTTCNPGSVCCSTPDGMYTCCPYNNGVCCEDGTHCCPESNVCCNNEGCCPEDHPKCDNTKKQCTKENGSDPIPWNPTNKK